MSLARVSVIRGSGPKKGVPFIDDYIHTSDTIVDYLTEYSGIQRMYRISCARTISLNMPLAGDLHPNYSTHVLLPLKVVYKKLRLLVDLGCIFVGHGLSKDFRIISESPSLEHHLPVLIYKQTSSFLLTESWIPWIFITDPNVPDD